LWLIAVELWFSTHWARPHTCGVACESHSFVWLLRSRHWAQHHLMFVERLWAHYCGFWGSAGLWGQKVLNAWLCCWAEGGSYW